ncbi:DUF4352 domain-containing protein [Peribacillus sp. SCS-155]|uniref:DUF4352 domain-containing protein n=1 Tax=Peribacillus sedimenti TaxID=3115297 RepID=UPI003905BE91
MKKLFYMIMFTLALAGCSAGNASEKPVEEQKASAEEKQEKTKPKTKEDVYVPNPQVTDDIKLVKVGETVTDAKGELTLKAYKQVNRTLKVGPIDMLVKDIKVVHFKPAYSMIDFFHGYTHDEEFDFVKVSMEVKNTSSDTMKYTPIAALKMNNGEHKTWEDDIYLEELTGEIAAGEVKKGNMGFILEKTDHTKWVELLTSDAVDTTHKIKQTAEHLKVTF